MKYMGKLVRVAFGSMLDILKQNIVSEVSVGDAVWGHDHPIVRLGNDILPKVDNQQNVFPSTYLRLKTKLNIFDVHQPPFYQ